VVGVERREPRELLPGRALLDVLRDDQVELDRLCGGRYVELDLIVPEYVKKSPTWEKLPWFAAFDADHAGGKTQDQTTVYLLGERSFVLVFPNQK
jgi:hypothetical protein